jgi:thiol-disulfide isomerase/thioredoxin
MRPGHAPGCRRGRCERVQLRKSAAPHAVRLRLAIIAVALIGIAAGVYVSYGQKGAGPFARSAAPKAIPELRFVDEAGAAHSLADFRGKVVLLNVWATWCEPCRQEMPALDRLQAKLGGERFQVVALSVDQQGAAVARKFYSEFGIKALRLYIDPSAKAAFVLDAPGLPATLLVDRTGREIGRHLGAVKWDAPEVVERLQRAMTAE